MADAQNPNNKPPGAGKPAPAAAKPAPAAAGAKPAPGGKPAPAAPGAKPAPGGKPVPPGGAKSAPNPTAKPGAPAAAAPTTPTPAPAMPSPIDDALTRVQAMREEMEKLQVSAKTLKGQLSNYDPNITRELKKQNDEFEKKIAELEKALQFLALEALQPTTSENSILASEILRTAVIDYCKENNIKVELWKNIES
ncbi:hypothetical protein K2X30_04420 [bacterium]|nr:hypothetical protein [bacterium]